MKRLVFLLVGSAVIAAFGMSPAYADNGPHKQQVWTVGQTYTVDNTTGTDRCAGCHRAHTAQGVDLLREEQPGLCFTCHGTAGAGAATDVLDGVGYVGADGLTPDKTRAGSVGALRGGGFQYALLNASTPEKEIYLSGTSKRSKNQHIYPLTTGAQATTSAHNANGTDVKAWGNGAVSATANVGATVQLACSSCHDPHGNGNYRILRSIPAQSGVGVLVTDANGVAPGGAGYITTYNYAPVTITDATDKVYTTNDYWLSGDSNTAPVTVGTATVDTFTANISKWCTSCHTRYLAPSGSYKTDSGDAVYKYRHRSDALKAISNAALKPDGVTPVYPDLYGTTKVMGGGAANCITCHVSHGSNATMGELSSTVTNPDGTTANVNQDSGDIPGPVLGDSRLLRVDNRGMCLMCHSV